MSQPTDSTTVNARRVRIVAVLMLVLAVLLGGYAMALNWLTERVASDMERTVRDVPVQYLPTAANSE